MFSFFLNYILFKNYSVYYHGDRLDIQAANREANCRFLFLAAARTARTTEKWKKNIKISVDHCQYLLSQCQVRCWNWPTTIDRLTIPFPKKI